MDASVQPAAYSCDPTMTQGVTVYNVRILTTMKYFDYSENKSTLNNTTSIF